MVENESEENLKYSHHNIYDSYDSVSLLDKEGNVQYEVSFFINVS